MSCCRSTTYESASSTLIDLAAAQLMADGPAANSPEPEAVATTTEEAWRLALLTDSGRNGPGA